MEPERWDPVVPRVLSGTVRLADIPEIPQRVVRVFLSSTGVGKCEHVLCSCKGRDHDSSDSLQCRIEPLTF